MAVTSPFIMVHGGAGPRAMTRVQRASVREALGAGYRLLARGRSSLDAVEAAIKVLEASGLFNAGVGSRLQLDGGRRMDASIMEGRTLRAGAVAAVERVRHPISAARLVMEQTAHVLLAGDAATSFARHFALELQRAPSRARRTRAGASTATRLSRLTLRTYKAMDTRSRRTRQAPECGTVGAVARDRAGRLAAGASTGGIGVMLPGRVGDSPLIGSGVYADDAVGAVSMTGMGESIIRLALAKDIIVRVAAGCSPARAAWLALAQLGKRVHGLAGTLVLAADGRFAIRHSTARMVAGYWGGKGEPVVADQFTRR